MALKELGLVILLTAAVLFVDFQIWVVLEKSDIPVRKAPDIHQGTEEDHDPSLYPELPQGKGRDLVINACIPCHSLKMVIQNKLTRENWDETIDWMQDEQGLRVLDSAERKAILDYLGKHFSPSNVPAAERGLIPLK